MGKEAKFISIDIAIFETTKGEAFIVDQEDAEKVSKYTWCFSKTGYLVANIQGKVTKLHRYLLHPNPSAIIDHRNGKLWDNRRSNLRECSLKENARNLKIKKTNQLGIKGIRVTAHGRYNARIVVDRQEIHLGNYLTVDEAIKARRQAEVLYYGEFAPCLSRPERDLVVTIQEIRG